MGVIKSREVVEPEQASGEKRVNTSVSASVSSGSGVSIGIGVLLGAMGSGPAKPSVRYSVELLNGETVTVYHESDQFETGDCVAIRSLPGDEKNPPQMKRTPDGCRGAD
jgi:hypothetical protein